MMSRDEIVSAITKEDEAVRNCFFEFVAQLMAQSEDGISTVEDLNLAYKHAREAYADFIKARAH